MNDTRDAVLLRAAELVAMDVEGKIRAGGERIALDVSHDMRAEGQMLSAALSKLAEGDHDLMGALCPGIYERAAADTEIPPASGEA